MNRTSVNLVIDALAAALFLAMLATGYVLFFALPQGTNKSLMLWGLTRHQWGDVHFWTGLGILGIVLLHLGLHWPWVVSVIGRRMHLTGANPQRLLLPGAATLAVVVGAFMLFAMAAHHSTTGLDGPRPGVCPPEHAAGGDSASGGAVVHQGHSGPTPEFWRDVYPVLERSCFSCHGPAKARGGFRVAQREDYFGKDGAAALVVPGHAGKSPLIGIVAGTRADMPLANRHTLPRAQVDLLKAWINAGARWGPQPEVDRPR